MACELPKRPIPILAAENLPTETRPSAAEILPYFQGLSADLKSHLGLSGLSFFTSIGIHAIHPFPLYPGDCDLSATTADIEILEKTIPTINFRHFDIIPHSLQREIVDPPIFPGLESQRLSFQVVWTARNQAYVYTVEIFDNDKPEFFQKLMSAAHPELPDSVVQELLAHPFIHQQNGIQVWRPELITLFYLHLQSYPPDTLDKGHKSAHRWETVHASRIAARARKNEGHR